MLRLVVDPMHATRGHFVDPGRRLDSENTEAATQPERHAWCGSNRFQSTQTVVVVSKVPLIVRAFMIHYLFSQIKLKLS